MIELPAAAALALNVLVWGCWSVSIGYLGHRRPTASFAASRWWSRLWPFETDGRFYARVCGIKLWKDRLPELGALFPGGFAKRSVRGTPEHLHRFVAETCRAEWVHWVVFWLWPVFALWNPPWAVLVMVLYATTANVPCIIVQRYNRARVLRVLERHAALAVTARARCETFSPAP